MSKQMSKDRITRIDRVTRCEKSTSFSWAGQPDVLSQRGHEIVSLGRANRMFYFSFPFDLRVPWRLSWPLSPAPGSRLRRPGGRTPCWPSPRSCGPLERGRTKTPPPNSLPQPLTAASPSRPRNLATTCRSSLDPHSRSRFGSLLSCRFALLGFPARNSRRLALLLGSSWRCSRPSSPGLLVCRREKISLCGTDPKRRHQLEFSFQIKNFSDNFFKPVF